MKPSARGVLLYLEAHPEGVSELDAIHAHLGTRLAARISDIKAAGYTVRDEWESYAGKRYKRYFLVTEPVQLSVFGS